MASPSTRPGRTQTRARFSTPWIYASFSLAFVGGILILAGGFGMPRFILSLFPFLESEAVVYLPGTAGVLVSAVILFVGILVALGGLTVMAGAAAVLYRHVRLGRLLIGLGGGAGFLGLLLAIFYSVVVQGLPFTLAHLVYWIGVLLAAGGRWLAGKARRSIQYIQP
jgi:hypothetical protein